VSRPWFAWRSRRSPKGTCLVAHDAEDRNKELLPVQHVGLAVGDHHFFGYSRYEVVPGVTIKHEDDQ
jgi:hypothetical protein